MLRDRLSPDAARRTAAAILDDLGRADRTRLEALLGLLGPDGRLRLGDALAATFPGQPREAALTAFRQLRGRIKAAAGDASVRFALEADSQTRTAPDERWCWFAGENSALAAMTRLGNLEMPEIRLGPQDALAPADLRDGKAVVRYFISYAHKDKALKDALMSLLHDRLDSASGYAFEPWDDRDIMVGEVWHDDIQRAIARCHFGLLLVSPALLASRYVREHELKHFVTADPSSPKGAKRAIPVALKRVAFDGTIDTKGLKALQIFHDTDGKTFAERGGNRRDRFVDELFAQIVKATAARLEPGLEPVPPVPAGRRPDLDARIRRSVEWREEACFVPTEGVVDTLDKLDPDAVRSRQPGERRNSLDFLEEWVRNPQAQPYCALLGEYGMGKTITCQAFTRRLLDARAAEPDLPAPIYLDLRHVGDAAKSEPDLLRILDTVLRRMWRGGLTEPGLSAQEVVQLVQEEGALAIFDGLDEVLVHLSHAAGQRFAREIFRILPPNRVRPKSGRPGRLLVTCRTEHFRTLRDQKTFLTTEDRDGVRADHYRVLILMPFTEAQIRTYLEQTLPDEDPDRALALIRAVHNLPELAKRPYTLSLITEHFPVIERWKLEGRRVTGVDLYRSMVRSWLERDTGKHQFTPDHKQVLMEFFAAELARSGRRVWSVGDVEQWLVDVLGARPALAAHYEGRDRELLKEDLRIATFLVREGEDDFRFAHTSLQEYFLAAYLRRALAEGRPADWDMPQPSTETLDFLGQMLSGGDRGTDAALDTLKAMRGTHRPRASELAFAYVLHAQAKDYPAPVPAGFRLDGADLRGRTIAGRPGRPALNLHGASFRGARLDDAVFRRVDLTNADFSGARLACAELIDGRGRGACFRGADLTGTLFRDLDLTEAEFSEATLYRTQWLRCRLPNFAPTPTLPRWAGEGAAPQGAESHDTEGPPPPSGGGRGPMRQHGEGGGTCDTPPESLSDRAPPAALFALCEPASPARPSPDARLSVLVGHRYNVTACVFSPDGRLIASASEDNTVRLWDARSGEVIRVLHGHTGFVTGCAFSPDGRLIASASEDSTVRLWDARSGESVRVLDGHTGFVTGCAFSPDGHLLASASWDNTVRLWDARSGESVRVLDGHTDAVTGCAFSPDGRLIASASRDKTVRLWETGAGEVIRILRGHTDDVTGCAFSPDGYLIASASRDKTVRLWETGAGEVVRILRGHINPVTGCALSPDGRLIASASWDNSVRLWEIGSGEVIRILRGNDIFVTGCAFSPDGRLLASTSWDNTVRLREAGSGEVVRILRGHINPVTGCAFSPDGRLIASASWDDTVRLWDAGSGEVVHILPGHAHLITGCAFSPDGRLVASASWDKTVRLWEAGSGDAVRVLEGHTATVTGCAFLPDGRLIASASEDNTVRLWEAGSGDAVRVLEGHTATVTGCAFLPDGRLIASASEDNTVRLWEAGSGDVVRVLEGHTATVTGCALSPDGRLIASASEDNTVRLWEAGSGDAVRVLEGHTATVTGCAFSPDGRLIASASRDKTVRLWEAGSGKVARILRGHTDDVTGCAFSPDGRLLASASWDSTVRLWEAGSGKVARILRGHAGSVMSCHFSNDGTRVLSAGNDGTLRFWDVATGRQTGVQIQHFQDGSWAVFDVATDRLVETGGEAWRWLGWLDRDAGGAAVRYPAEVFGPLPVSKLSRVV